jgi:hypothetical protein
MTLKNIRLNHDHFHIQTQVVRINVTIIINVEFSAQQTIIYIILWDMMMTTEYSTIPGDSATVTDSDIVSVFLCVSVLNPVGRYVVAD